MKLKLKQYKKLLSKSYDEAVDFLLQKYGPAQDDYYREKSYLRFMNQEIKNITKGKFTRTSEGLYCHHIDENKILNISEKQFVLKNKIPFDYQKRNRLVYCDLIEHSILHVLIAKETSLEFGYPGLTAFLEPIIIEWYLDQKKPNIKWMEVCYTTSFLESQEAFSILNEMHDVLGVKFYKNICEYYEEKKSKEYERKKWINDYEQNVLDKKKHLMNDAKLLHDKSPRQTIVEIAYQFKHSDDRLNAIKNRKNNIKTKSSGTYEEFNNEMKIYPKDMILKKLKLYIDKFDKH
ncbi:MAG: hypothetical protein ACTIDE_09125 [Carnobacterium maltaromaticum]